MPPPDPQIGGLSREVQMWLQVQLYSPNSVVSCSFAGGPAAAVPPAMPVLLHVALVEVHVHKPPVHLQGGSVQDQS